MKSPIEIDFNALSPVVRTRLLTAFEGKALFSQPSSQKAIPYAISVFGAALLYLAAVAGFGGVGSKFALQPSLGMGLYALAIAMMAYPLLDRNRNRNTRSRLLWQPGRYILAHEIVDATTPTLKIWSLSEFPFVRNSADSNAQPFLLHFCNDRQKLSFQFTGRDEAERLLRSISRTHQAIAEAEERNDETMLARLDPLRELRESGWKEAKHTKQDASSIPSPPLRHRAELVCVGLGLLLGLPTWATRNHHSDAALVDAMHANPRSTDWQWYIDQRGSMAEEALLLWLPKSALSEAQDVGSVTALRHFKERFSNPEYKPFVDEANRSIHDLFEQARDAFSEQASTANDQVIPFFTDLLSWLEEHDSPTVQVSFGTPDPQQIKGLDYAAIADHGGQWQPPGSSKNLTVTAIAPHFDSTSSMQRESVITRMLQDGLAEVMPRDILDLAQVQNSDETRPVIQMDYTISPMRDAWPPHHVSMYFKHNSSGDPIGDRAFIGVQISFMVRMRIPDSDETLEFPVVVEPPDKFTVSDNSFLTDTSSDARIYETMAVKAFGDLAAELRTALFREGSAGYAAVVLPEQRALKHILVEHLMLDNVATDIERSAAVGLYQELVGEDLSPTALETAIAKHQQSTLAPSARFKQAVGTLNEPAKRIVVFGAGAAIMKDGHFTSSEEPFWNQTLQALELSDEQAQAMMQE